MLPFLDHTCLLCALGFNSSAHGQLSGWVDVMASLFFDG